jgi:uncharacterized protein YndB with AHSA1/START domain
MIEPPAPACLVIADISGYTTYLAGVELDHATDIIADLVGTLARSIRPTFTLAKLEGDAAFAWASPLEVDGSALQDAVEGIYFAFQARLRDIRQATSCECNACVLLPSLDLKIVVHHGLVARQRMADLDELLGRDVILVHRLLKNEVETATGFRAYALYTQAAVDAVGIDTSAPGFVPHTETVDVIGEVRGWVSDLEAAWRREQERRRFVVTADEAFATNSVDIAAPPALVWEFLTAPRLRPLWQTGIIRVDEQVGDGRRGAGTVNHCVHGGAVTVEEVLDWQPPTSRTVRTALPVPGATFLVITDVLIEVPGGTRLESRVAPPRPEEREAWEAIVPGMEDVWRQALRNLVDVTEAESTRRAASRAAEPDVPATEARYLVPIVRDA